MNLKLPLALIVLIAAAFGYVLGTENGRAQRDVVLVKLGRKDADDNTEAATDVAGDAAPVVEEAAADAAEEAAEATSPA